MSQIKDRNILITGGASGIGLLMAQRVSELGAKHVVIWDINNAALERVKKDLVYIGNTTIHTYKVDVSNSKNVEEVAQDVLSDIGTIDILFNNAGIIVGKSFEEHSYYDIEKTMGVNTLGCMFVARAFLPGMIDQRRGHVVNIASAAGLMANPGMTVYASSKWGVVGWSESLRIELQQNKSGVHVTTVMPSYIDTGMFEGVTPPLLVPWLKPDAIVKSIIKAVLNNKIQLKRPFMVNLTPILRGILPTRVFDFVAGKIFRVYDSMSTFKGRVNE